jgi:CheY-like chemotaxis protein
MTEALTQELLGKHAFDALNMVFDESLKVAENYTAVIPKVAEGRIVNLCLTGPLNYRVVLRTNHAGGLALASGVFDCSKGDVKPSMVDDAMLELIKMVAGQIRNTLAPTDQLAEPLVLSSDETLSSMQATVGTRLCLGNDEALVDVTVTEPRPTVAAPVAAATAAVTSVAVAQSGDDAVAVVKAAVQSAGMQVVSQTLDGARALDEVKQLRPDVVCLDFNMANMKGLDVFTAIRSEIPNAIIFLVSAAATADNVRSALKLRPNGIVVRPFDSKRLLADINRALEQRRSK